MCFVLYLFAVPSHAVGSLLISLARSFIYSCSWYDDCSFIYDGCYFPIVSRVICSQIVVLLLLSGYDVVELQTFSASRSTELFGASFRQTRDRFASFAPKFLLLVFVFFFQLFWRIVRFFPHQFNLITAYFDFFRIVFLNHPIVTAHASYVQVFFDTIFSFFLLSFQKNRNVDFSHITNNYIIFFFSHVADFVYDFLFEFALLLLFRMFLCWFVMTVSNWSITWWFWCSTNFKSLISLVNAVIFSALSSILFDKVPTLSVSKP